MILQVYPSSAFEQRDSGGNSPVLVLLHDVLMNGHLCDEVIAVPSDRYRVIDLELSFGARSARMPNEAESQETMIAGLVQGLDLQPLDHLWRTKLTEFRTTFSFR